jgi:glycosyltransferase involved in cell wall biosynthesis
MPEILRAHPAATLTIAGVGEMETQLRELVARLGVPGHVQFLGYTREASLVDWYRRATLVVMPTVALEGFGLTAAEALACGTPVVGTPVGAIPEVLGPLDSAMLSMDNSSTALADAIIGLLAEPARLASIGARAPAFVRLSFGWRSVAARYMQAYEEMLATPRPTRARRSRR